jgi:hypothetical protein
VPLQKFQILDFDRVLPPDAPDDARHRVRMPRAIERGARVIQVDPLERRREAIAVALAPDFPVGHDVDTGRFLRADGQQRGVVLRLFQPRFRHAPQLARAHAGRKPPGELGAIDEPIRLWVAAHEGGRKKHA